MRMGRSQYKNTADTSKALRQMVQDGLVMRSGAGGKGNPFLYRVSTYILHLTPFSFAFKVAFAA